MYIYRNIRFILILKNFVDKTDVSNYLLIFYFIWFCLIAIMTTLNTYLEAKKKKKKKSSD